ncbi:hypothetical protein [Actinoplanes palleronii]|uniref:Uncharacterized protein n=1 Tax=Actinoplanes palleronii TaxID=113570 RepID=A0ABQ4B9R1_9ACTN|nr:hypothetical protein [Actinoplanes palleronii]GIE67136.1 hypothetical protein Apa02nite_032440 [Actinoplanes palleronii]
MKTDDELLELIRHDQDLADLLGQTCEFDLSRGDHGATVSLSSGAALEAVAGDFTGGTFFLCGERRPARPVLYASSECQAGLIGRDLADALAIMIGLPSWSDCLGFSGDGNLAVMRSAAEYLRRDEIESRPGADAERERLATALSLTLAPIPVLLGRLHETVTATGPDFVLAEGPYEYESLFGPFLPSRNPLWR